jgi:hypothetical protein
MKFFKPTKISVISFIILVVLIYILLYITGAPFFACETFSLTDTIKSQYPGAVELCSLEAIGIFHRLRYFTNVRIEPAGYIFLIITLFIIPYLVGQTINKIINK